MPHSRRYTLGFLVLAVLHVVASRALAVPFFQEQVDAHLQGPMQPVFYAMVAGGGLAALLGWAIHLRRRRTLVVLVTVTLLTAWTTYDIATLPCRGCLSSG